MPKADWTSEEVLIVCGYLHRLNWIIPRANSEICESISKTLRSLPLFPEERVNPSFRSRDSVHRKMSDLQTARPSYVGTQTKGGVVTQKIAKDYESNPTEISQRATFIIEAINRGEMQNIPPLSELQDEIGSDLPTSALEGWIQYHLTMKRERDPKLRKSKIKSILRKTGDLRCEVCNFSFEEVYGERGHGYIEIHHVTPLHLTNERRTHIDDLAGICSNCHRMIHAKDGLLTPQELAKIINTAHTTLPYGEILHTGKISLTNRP